MQRLSRYHSLQRVCLPLWLSATVNIAWPFSQSFGTVGLGLVLGCLLGVRLMAGAESSLVVRPERTTVPQFEKIEFTLEGAGQHPNPYDPDKVSLSLEFTTPTRSSVVLPAFYYQSYDHQRRPHGGQSGEWVYPVGLAVWKGRYAPAEVGVYSCVATLKTAQDTVVSMPVTFQCTASTNHGFVRVARADPRFLQLDDGTPFFAIGQNVAFVKDTYDVIGILERMAAHGANFARIWTCCEDWALALEARKSAWGRSWDWRPPWSLLPGRDGYLSEGRCVRVGGEARATVPISPSRPLALRPATRYVLQWRALTTERAGLTVDVLGKSLGEPVSAPKQWTACQREFTTGTNTWWLEGMGLRLTNSGTAWVRGFSLQEAGRGPNLLWEADPELPVLGHYHQWDSFLLDTVLEAAERTGIYLQLCLLTRDLYMERLVDPARPEYHEAVADAQRLLRYVIARWGYSTRVVGWEYFNEMNPGLPNERFYAELGLYLQQNDPYRHLRTTSAWSPAPKDWRHPQLDTANLHYYLRPAEKARFKDEVAAVLDRAAFLMRESPGKPAFFGEYGLARDDWQPSPYSDEDSAYLHLHNGLWASALSGLAGTVHPWWWENLGKHDGYRHYRAVAAFMADVPLGQVPFEPLRIKTSETRWRAVGLATLGQTYFWLSDSQATWHRQTVEKQPISESHGVEVSLDRLEPGTYRVTWWHTQTGETLRTQDVATDGPTLRLLAPDFTSDLACKARRIGVRSKYSTNGLEHGQQGSTVIYTDYVSYR